MPCSANCIAEFRQSLNGCSDLLRSTIKSRTRVLLAENDLDVDAVPPSPGDVWPPALAPTPAPRPRTVASSDAGAAATSSDKKAGPFAGFRKRFGGGAKGEEL